MRDLYTRLSSVGFDKKWVRTSILPDWWDDELASVPFNRAVAEAAISGHLGFHIRLLRDPDAELPRLDPSGGFCFKRNQKVDLSRVAPSLQVVKRAAAIVVSATPNLPRFVSGKRASDLRKQFAGPVTLPRLLDYCWNAGIVVIGVSHLPSKSAKFDGVAMFVGERPVIILASGKDGPPWLTFDLAHEVGHLMHGHVRAGDKGFVDAKLTDNVDDSSELEADEFALELLTGSPEGIKFQSGAFKAQEIGPLAANFARIKRPDLDPGMVVLSYCKSTSYWGVAKGGLESLKCASGGHAIVAKALAAKLEVDLLSEPELRFIGSTCALRIRLTEEERRLIDGAAKSRSLDSSAWARSELLALAKRLVKKNPKPDEENE